MRIITGTTTILIKVVHKGEDELPNMTEKESLVLREKLVETAKAFSKELGKEVLFRGTYKDDEQLDPYCEWTVSELEIPKAVRLVRIIIEQVVGKKPSIEHVYAPKRII